MTYAHRSDGDTTRARATFGAGAERHDTAARRLHRKRRELRGPAAEWVATAGMLLACLNTPIRGAARRHIRALLGHLGWRDVPPEVMRRLKALISPSNSSGLADFKFNA